jgi:hypothetical protein
VSTVPASKKKDFGYLIKLVLVVSHIRVDVVSWFKLSALSRRSLRLGGEVFSRAFTAETPRTQRWRRE